MIAVGNQQISPVHEGYPDFPSAVRNGYAAAHNTTTKAGVTCKETFFRFLRHPTIQRVQIHYQVFNRANRRSSVDARDFDVIFMPLQTTTFQTPPSTTSTPATTGTDAQTFPTQGKSEGCSTLPSSSNADASSGKDRMVQESTVIIVATVLGGVAVTVVVSLLVALIIQQRRVNRWKNQAATAGIRRDGLNNLTEQA